MKALKLPKQQEVREIDLGTAQSHVVKVTPENQGTLGDTAMELAIGEKCRYCLREYSSIADMRARSVVFAGVHEHGHLACKACWEANNQ
jgi:hypothetical protein